MRESSHIEWKRGNTPLAEFKENNTGYHGDSKNRSEIFSNGTLRLDSTQEHDTGTYSVDVFNGEGNIIQHETVQLFIISYKETTAVSGVTGSSEFLYFGKTEFQNIYDIRWKKEGSLVAEFKGPTPRYYGDYGSRAEVFNNGTLRLDETQETDTGNYSVDFFYKNGTKNKIHTQLFLIDAVSEPELNYTCTPDGKVEFHCFLEKGADPSFTWSLNYKTLDGNSAPHSAKSQTLVLKDITGYVVCTAENSVSKQQSPIVFYSCEENADFQKVYGVLGKSVFLHVSNKNLLNGIDILWKRGTVPVARLKESTVFYYGDYENKANIFTNGTLRLDKIDDADTGPYSVVVSDANGRNIHSEIAQLFMMNGVSQPEVKYTCLPNGKIQFNCSVEKGSDPLFQWSLDGNILVGETAFHTIKKNVAVLYHVVSGKLICIVANNASESYSDPISFACEEENINTHSHQFESIETLLGTSVFFQFKSSGLAIGSDIVWKKGGSPVAWLQNNGTVCNGDYKNRAEIFANGSLKLDKTRETDSGNYSVDVFTKHGTKIRRRIAKLIIIGHTEFLPVYGAVDSSVFLFMKNNTDLENMSPL
ncbi:UNVERIFIED_CONTAM: hypothetical protein FKN15_027758 [Acipenser sinensis]